MLREAGYIIQTLQISEIFWELTNVLWHVAIWIFLIGKVVKCMFNETKRGRLSLSLPFNFTVFFIFKRYFYASSSFCSLACLIHVCNTSALLRVKSIFVIAIIPWCAELGLCVCLLWYNISKSTDVEPNSQHASKNQILFSFPPSIT